MEHLTKAHFESNPISFLNEYCQKNRYSIPRYKCIKASILNNGLTEFIVVGSIQFNYYIVSDDGCGKSKKKAKRETARKLALCLTIRDENLYSIINC